MELAFVGTGMIGGGLAVDAALNGNDVTLYDVLETEKVKENIKGIYNIMVKAGACTQEAADKAFAAMKFTQDMKEAVTGAEFVQECVPERLELKQSTYKQVQEIAGNTVVIASSTSTMFPSKLSAGALYPEKIVVGHPYNPSYLLPLIEVCGPQASEDTIAKAMEVYKAMGKEPVLCKKEVPGFIVNKISWDTMDNAMAQIANDVCSVEDLDKALIYGPGMRMAITGQMLTMSLGVKGGLRAMNGKYGEEDPERVRIGNLVADGVDAEMANRPEFMGTDFDSVTEFRDKTIADILKLYKKL